MKAFTLMMLLVPCITCAEEKRSLGKSPDGRFELMLKAEKPDDHGWVVIQDTRSGNLIETETAQGYSHFQTDDIHASWKSDSSAFAVGLRGTKTSTDTDIYFKDGAVWEKIESPPFVANILGRQGVFSKGRNQKVDFAGFEGDSRFALICQVEPDFQQKEATGKITDWKPSPQTEWRVVLEYQRRTNPNCEIGSIEPFTETEPGGGGQSATRSEPDSEGGDKPQPESEGRSR